MDPKKIESILFLIKIDKNLLSKFWIPALLVFPLSLGIIIGCICRLYQKSIFLLSIEYFVLFLTIPLYFYWNMLIFEERSLDESNNGQPDNLNQIIDRDDLTESDKYIVQHLLDRHNNQLTFVDALDTKYSQIIAINVVILSFIFDKMKDAQQQSLFILGIFIIFSSIIIGIRGYACRDMYVGASRVFFEKYSSFSPINGLNELMEQLIIEIDRNKKIQNFRGFLFNVTLIINIVGLLIVIVGYYAP